MRNARAVSIPARALTANSPRKPRLRGGLFIFNQFNGLYDPLSIAGYVKRCMQTRQLPRRKINLPGRYFTGQGVPTDVILRDISEGGCRFPAGAFRPNLGQAIQIYVGPTGPHKATITWAKDGEIGITFRRKLPADLVASFQSSHIPDPSSISVADAFEAFDAADDQSTRRFC